MSERITRITVNPDRARVTIYTTNGCLGVLENDEAMMLMQGVQAGLAAIDTARKAKDEAKSDPV